MGDEEFPESSVMDILFFMEYKKQSNCRHHCKYHIVLVTKYRRKIFNDGIHEYMRLRLEEIKNFYPELEIEEINHDIDHIHVLMWIPPKMSVWKVVWIIKSNTSRHLKQKFPFLKDVYYGTDGIWSDWYFVSTVWLNERVIEQYIENQWKEDSGQAKLEFR